MSSRIFLLFLVFISTDVSFRREEPLQILSLFLLFYGTEIEVMYLLQCYVDPSNECKFYSKPDVLRYLKSVGINHPACEETKNKSVSCHSAIKVC